MLRHFRILVAVDVTECVKTRLHAAALKDGLPYFRSGAFSFATRDPRTLFSFSQYAILEFSHGLVSRRKSHPNAAASSEKRLRSSAHAQRKYNSLCALRYAPHAPSVPGLPFPISSSVFVRGRRSARVQSVAKVLGLFRICAICGEIIRV